MKVYGFAKMWTNYICVQVVSRGKTIKPLYCLTRDYAMHPALKDKKQAENSYAKIVVIETFTAKNLSEALAYIKDNFPEEFL